jgi:hypothetical protein
VANVYSSHLVEIGGVNGDTPITAPDAGTVWSMRCITIGAPRFLGICKAGIQLGDDAPVLWLVSTRGEDYVQLQPQAYVFWGMWVLETDQVLHLNAEFTAGAPFGCTFSISGYVLQLP